MAKIDWDEWRLRYVTGSDLVTLEALSKEPNAPALNTLKKKSSKDLWAEQRERFRHQKDTVAANDATAVAAANEVKQIINAAEMLTQHARAARLVRQKALQAIEYIDPTTLKPADAIAWLKLAVEIERLTEGLATERQALTHDGGVEVKVTRRIVDASS